MGFADEELFALRPRTGCRLAGRLAGRTVLLKAALAAVHRRNLAFLRGSGSTSSTWICLGSISLTSRDVSTCPVSVARHSARISARPLCAPCSSGRSTSGGRLKPRGLGMALGMSRNGAFNARSENESWRGRRRCGVWRTRHSIPWQVTSGDTVYLCSMAQILAQIGSTPHKNVLCLSTGTVTFSKLVSYIII